MHLAKYQRAARLDEFFRAAEHFDFRAFNVTLDDVRRRRAAHKIVERHATRGHPRCGGLVCDESAYTAVWGRQIRGDEIDIPARRPNARLDDCGVHESVSRNVATQTACDFRVRLEAEHLPC